MGQITAAAAMRQKEFEKVPGRKCNGSGAGRDREEGEGIQDGCVCLNFYPWVLSPRLYTEKREEGYDGPTACPFLWWEAVLA